MRYEDAVTDIREIEHVNAEADPGRKDAMVCALTAHRRPDKLNVGDQLPVLELVRLGSDQNVRLDTREGLPLVLFFGSYT